MAFEVLMRNRSAAEYADFVLRFLGGGDRVIDVGCGPGSITIGLAQVAGHVTGVDLDEAEFTDARAYASKHGIDNVEFLEGSIYQLDFADVSFDVCTLFSMMETLNDPLAGLAEVRRVVKPGGLVGASSVEYGGLVLHGPDERLLHRFYELRLRLWEAQGDVHFYRGRELRGLLLAAGFAQVEAVATYFYYGTEERVRTFGLGALRTAGTSGTWAASRTTGSQTRTRLTRWSRPGSAGQSHPIRSPPSRGAGRSDVAPDRDRGRAGRVRAGGQQDATIRLNEMNKTKGEPWQLSSSYGRALQQSSLMAWGGDAINVEGAQRALRHRAKMNGLARNGGYSSELENSTA